MNTLLKNVFATLHSNDIIYCVLRDGAALDTVDVDYREIDLLIDAAQLEHFDRLMRELGFYFFSRWGYAPHRHYVKTLDSSTTSFELDVVTHIEFGFALLDLKTTLAKNCLQKRQLVHGVYLPSAEDELFVVLLHCLLDKNRITPTRGARIQSLREQVTNKPYISKLCEQYWSSKTSWSEIDGLIAAGQWSELLAQRKSVAIHMMRQDVIGSWTRTVSKLTLRKLDRVLRMTRRTLVSRA